VIMDVHMPERDGIETAEIIRKSELNALTPIIFLTADTTESELPRSAYQSGAVDVMYKPLEAVRLRAKVSVFLDLYLERQKTLNLMDTLRAAQADQIAQEKARAVSSLIGSMSHSLNNQLCVAEGFASVLLDDAAENQVVYLKKVMGAIRESTAMLQKVQNFVGAGASGASRLEPAEKVFSEFEQGLLAISSDTNQFSVQLDETGACVEVPSRLPNVLMFPLVQFVSELAQGIDAVTRSEFNIQSVDRGGDQHLMIRMSTSGLPIDEALLETVNDFFGSADVTAQERGIAIAGVKSLMDSMSGSLHLASTEAGFEVVLEAPLTQLKRRLGDAS
jgi:CheY-like chemotaxis protein